MGWQFSGECKNSLNLLKDYSKTACKRYKRLLVCNTSCTESNVLEQRLNVCKKKCLFVNAVCIYMVHYFIISFKTHTVNS